MSLKLVPVLALVLLLVFQIPVTAATSPAFSVQYCPPATTAGHAPVVQKTGRTTQVIVTTESDVVSVSASSTSVIRLNSSVIVSTAGTYGTSIVFGPISGMPSNYTVQNNSARLTDSYGKVVNVSNGPFSSGVSGTLDSFTVTLMGNLSGGPFTLSILSGGNDFQLAPAGIASVPSTHPAISVFPADQYIGGHVTIMVSGFPANYNAGYPVMDNTSMNRYSTGTDRNGAGYVGLDLPGIPGGNYSVRFSNYMAIRGNGTVLPFMSIVPSSGHVGQDVLALLTGFRSRSSVYITWPGSQLNVSGRMNGYGKGVVAFTVPVSQLGSHSVYASSLSGQYVSTPFVINQTSIFLSNDKGSPGMPLSVIGTGFVQGNAVQLLINGRVYRTASAPVMANGTAVLSIPVPALAAGRYSFSLGSASGLVSNSTYFTVRPLLISNITNIRQGETVLVRGYYFSPDSRVDLFWYSGRAATSVSSGSNGSFSLSINVPAVPGGPEFFGAIDAQGNNATPVMLFMAPSISSDVPSGFAGQGIVITGNGFHSGRYLAFLWDGNNTGRTAVTNGSGSFSTVFVVPSAVPGSYILSVNNSSAGQIIFTVVQKLPWTDYLPAIILPLVTGVVASIYLRRRIRNR